MSSDSDNDCAAAILLAIAIKRKKRKNEHKRKIWCKDLYARRHVLSRTVLLKELEFTSANDFKNYVRMNKDTFDELLHKIHHRIEKQNTTMRAAIPPHHRLAITLRYLASGMSYGQLRLLTAIAPGTIAQIVIDTCEAIISELKGFIKLPQTQNEWKKEARDFDDHWNFPHCLGAIDGKHIKITHPPGSGTKYLNYERNYSIVLMAIVNANYEFLMVDVGTKGRVSGAGPFYDTKFFLSLHSKTLHIPDPEPLPGSEENLPFVFVANDAFPLLENIMKPFSDNTLEKEEIIFNKRLSQTLGVVENAFGILTSRFKVLQNTFSLAPEKITLVAQTCCYLHNFLLSRNDSAYFDVEYVESNMEFNEEDSLQSLHDSNKQHPTNVAKTTREKYCSYFNTAGEVPLENNI